MKSFSLWASVHLSLLGSVLAFDVGITYKNYQPQICSGMWASDQTFINVTFDQASQGQVALVIYEWADVPYLGYITPGSEDDYIPLRTYICTANAVKRGLCPKDDMGKFILDLPQGKTINDTTFWSALVKLPASATTTSLSTWDNSLAGNSFLPSLNNDGYSSPWRGEFSRPFPRFLDETIIINPSPISVPFVYEIEKPIQYQVRQQGYYCVAIVPVISHSDGTPPSRTYPAYSGTVHFRNSFDGKLAASDYPKLNFYLILTVIYVVFGCLWGWMCWRHYDELQPIQHYLSLLVALLPIEMLANYTYYRYLNAYGKGGTGATGFLIIVTILDALRNSLSFFLLLIISLGLSVVRRSLGKATMIRAGVLAVCHFISAVLFAISIVEFEPGSSSVLVLLMLVLPLAFTSSVFLLWSMYSLNATIRHLRTHEQKYQLSTFTSLNRVLIGIVCAIGVVFVVCMRVFRSRLAEGFSVTSWAARWWLLDGWLALLYLFSFVVIAFLLRPSGYNQGLVMFDELAQDEDDAEDDNVRNEDDNDIHVENGGGHT